LALTDDRISKEKESTASTQFKMAANSDDENSRRSRQRVISNVSMRPFAEISSCRAGAGHERGYRTPKRNLDSAPPTSFSVHQSGTKKVGELLPCSLGDNVANAFECE
jgi:hypothetical protein